MPALPKSSRGFVFFPLMYPVMPTLLHVCVLCLVGFAVFCAQRGVFGFEILMLLATIPQRVSEAGVPS